MGYLVRRDKDHLGYNRDPFIRVILGLLGFTLVAPIAIAQISHPGAGLEIGALGIALMACAGGLHLMSRAWDFDRVHRTIVFTPLVFRWKRKAIAFDEVRAIEFREGGLVEEYCTQLWNLELVLHDSLCSRLLLNYDDDRGRLLSEGMSLARFLNLPFLNHPASARITPATRANHPR